MAEEKTSESGKPASSNQYMDNKTFIYERLLKETSPAELEKATQEYYKRLEEYNKELPKRHDKAFRDLSIDLKNLGIKIEPEKLKEELLSANKDSPQTIDPVHLLAERLGVDEKNLSAALEKNGFIIRKTNGAIAPAGHEGAWGAYVEKYQIEFSPKDLARPFDPRVLVRKESPIIGRWDEEEKYHKILPNHDTRILDDTKIKELLSSFQKPEGVENIPLDSLAANSGGKIGSKLIR